MDFMKTFEDDDESESSEKEEKKKNSPVAEKSSSDESSNQSDHDHQNSDSNTGSGQAASGSESASNHSAKSEPENEENEASSNGGDDNKESGSGDSSAEERESTGAGRASRSGEEEEGGNDEEMDKNSEGQSDSDSKSTTPTPAKKKKKRNSKDEVRELLEIADVCRRSGRQRKEVTQFQVGSDNDGKRSKRRDHRASKRVINDSESDDSEQSSNSSGSVRKKKRPKRETRSKQSTKSKKRGRRVASDSDEDDYSDDGPRRTTRGGNTAKGKKSSVNYKEVGSDEDLDSDDVLEWDNEDSKMDADTVADVAETIERVLDNRRGIPGAVGYPTTRYNVQDKGDPNAGFVPRTDEKGERHYLIKWVNWSHLHNTWESEESLATMGAKGIKKLENYIKRMKEIEKWKKRADKESIEYFDCEHTMNEQLLETYTRCERIIAHQMARESSNDSDYEYYVKWCGLPHADCTWEDGKLLSRYANDQIDAYHTRIESQLIPNKNCPYLRRRPKFERFDEQPDFITITEEHQLRDYQLTGVNWMLRAWCKSNSVILADEMGLGKTIQTISFLSALYHHHKLYGPFLVVVPLSTMAAWQREFAKWAPNLNLVTYLGDVSSRNVIRQYEWFLGGTKKLKCNAVLTTYEIILKDKSFLGSVDWAVLMVDEAHRLKNDESLLYQSLKSFNTNHRLLITGTPLQNSLKELFSLLAFIMPDKFDSWADWEEKHKDAEKGGFRSLHAELESYLLRRVKKDVEKSLPAKVEQILRVDMTSMQRKYYKLILTRNYRELSRGVKGSITGFINIVMELKKCCNHIHLVRAPDEDEKAGEELQALLKGSGKLILLDKLLKKLHEQQHRVLIFSQMVMMLDVIQEYLQMRRWNYQRLDGSMGSSLRDQALDHFNAPDSTDFCFLLSTRAGGLGINLATADTVIIFDSDWNPQNDLQAQARAHRIGQKKQVNIYRLVTRSSVEEDIVERAKQKLVLDHLVIQRMDTTGRTVLAKNAVSSNTRVPFDKSELTDILKFGAAELFSKDDNEEEPDVDVDDILQRAETREMDETGGMANELLDAFKVANFAIDEDRDVEEATQSKAKDSSVIAAAFADWESIIPEEDRVKVLAEEQQENIIDGPRQRTKIQQMARNEDSDEGKSAHKPKKTKPEGDAGSDDDESDSVSDSSDDDRGRVKKRRAKYTILSFTENEVRKFLRAFRRFAEPLERLDAIAECAELSEHSQSELKALCEELLKQCKQAQDEYDAAAKEKEKTSPTDESVKKPVRDRGPSFKFGGVEVFVRALMKTPLDLASLYAVMPSNEAERKCFEIPGTPKDCRNWDVTWEKSDDELLLRGVYDYGMGSWESIKMDPMLGLTEKIMVTDKLKKPQAKHLVQRVEFLLKYLERQNNPKTSGRAGKESEDAHAKAKKAPAKKTPVKEKDTKKKPLKKGELKTEVKAEKQDDPKKPKIAQIAEIIADLEVEKQFETAVATSTSAKFQDCVNILRPITRAMKLLTNPEQEGDTTRGLLKLGDHIGSYLIKNENRFSTHKLRNKWFSILWLFASKFIDDDALSLVDKYKLAASQRETTEPVQDDTDHKKHHHHKHKHHHKQHEPKEKDVKPKPKPTPKEKTKDDSHDHKPSTSTNIVDGKPLKSALKKSSNSSSASRDAAPSDKPGSSANHHDRGRDHDKEHDKRDKDAARSYRRSDGHDRDHQNQYAASNHRRHPSPDQQHSRKRPQSDHHRHADERYDRNRGTPIKRSHADDMGYQRTGYSRPEAQRQGYGRPTGYGGHDDPRQAAHRGGYDRQRSSYGGHQDGNSNHGFPQHQYQSQSSHSNDATSFADHHHQQQYGGGGGRPSYGPPPVTSSPMSMPPSHPPHMPPGWCPPPPVAPNMATNGTPQGDQDYRRR